MRGRPTLHIDTQALQPPLGEGDGDLFPVCLESPSLLVTRHPFEAYTICELLGIGGSGHVYRAVHRATGEVYALKALPLSTGGRLNTLVKEVDALSSGCPGMIKLHATSIHEESLYLVLEYMNAGCLDKVVASHGALPEAPASALAYLLLWCLSKLRAARLLHRDIKPSNVLLSTQGRVRLGDAGLMSTLQHSVSTAHSYVGTCRYMAPERIQHGSYSFPSDVWGVGLSLWLAVMGRVPFAEAQSYVEVIGAVSDTSARVETPPNGTLVVAGAGQQRPLDLSPHFREILDGCLAKDPLERLTPEALMALPIFTDHGTESVGKAEGMLRDFLSGGGVGRGGEGGGGGKEGKVNTHQPPITKGGRGGAMTPVVFSRQKKQQPPVEII